MTGLTCSSLEAFPRGCGGEEGEKGRREEEEEGERRRKRRKEGERGKDREEEEEMAVVMVVALTLTLTVTVVVTAAFPSHWLHVHLICSSKARSADPRTPGGWRSKVPLSFPLAHSAPATCSRPQPDLPEPGGGGARPGAPSHEAGAGSEALPWQPPQGPLSNHLVG